MFEPALNIFPQSVVLRTWGDSFIEWPYNNCEATLGPNKRCFGIITPSLSCLCVLMGDIFLLLYLINMIHFKVLLEPGTPQGSKIISQMRSYILWMEKRVCTQFMIKYSDIWRIPWQCSIELHNICSPRSAARAKNLQVLLQVKWRVWFFKKICWKMVPLWLPPWVETANAPVLVCVSK